MSRVKYHKFSYFVVIAGNETADNRQLMVTAISIWWVENSLNGISRDKGLSHFRIKGEGRSVWLK